MEKRLSRLSRRSLVGVIAGLAFAAAAGVGLATITTSEPSGTASAVTTTSGSTGTQTTSTGEDNDDANDMLEFERDDDNGSTSTAQQPHSTTSEQEQETGDEGAGQEKVEVCHMTGSGTAHTINIARPAVTAHIAHGDTEGACAATTTSAQTTTARVKKPKHQHSSTHATNASHAAPHVVHATPRHVSTRSFGHASHPQPSHGNGGGNGNGHNK